jgi:hypothetical protein
VVVVEARVVAVQYLCDILLDLEHLGDNLQHVGLEFHASVAAKHLQKRLEHFLLKQLHTRWARIPKKKQTNVAVGVGA